MIFPEPPISADTDVRDLDGFMLNTERLMASELVALSSHEAIASALFLWCRAWKQLPAASLPDDERVIAAFAKLPLPRFRKLRGEVMRGFVKCSDERWYHTVLAEEASIAFAKKLAFHKKRETDSERLKKWRNSQRETRFVAEGQGQGQGQGQTKTIDSTNAIEKSSCASVTPAQLSATMRRHSIEAQSGDPRVIAAAEAGVTVATVDAACSEAKSKKKGQRISAGYVLSIAEAWTREAATSRTGSPRVFPGTYHDERAETIAALTGRGESHERSENDDNIIDI